MAVPNPNPVALAVDLAGSADALDIAVYTKALALALSFKPSAFKAGWNRVILPAAFGRLPNGIYYVLIKARRGSATSAPLLLKVMVLR